jgi:hypothetical protein
LQTDILLNRLPTSRPTRLPRPTNDVSARVLGVSAGASGGCPRWVTRRRRRKRRVPPLGYAAAAGGAAPAVDVEA